MRCPYCGGLNSDQAQFCVRCGRDIAVRPPVQANTPRTRAAYPPPPQPQQPSYQPPRQPAAERGYPRPVAPPSPSPQAPSPQQRQPPSATTQARGRRNAEVQPASLPPVPTGPEPPAPFPPRTVQQLKDLEQGALNYSVVSSEENVGRKKIVRILYQHCVPWQQVATLFKALQEQQADKFDTVIVQGIYSQESSVYGFTNGQIQFDRSVRLGSQVQKRYQIETGNGFANDSLRIVLSE